jgi:hypothetical protein
MLLRSAVGFSGLNLDFEAWVSFYLFDEGLSVLQNGFSPRNYGSAARRPVIGTCPGAYP